MFGRVVSFERRGAKAPCFRKVSVRNLRFPALRRPTRRGSVVFSRASWRRAPPWRNARVFGGVWRPENTAFLRPRKATATKTTCFCGPTPTPLSGPSPAGGAGPGCATPRENRPFRPRNSVLPRRRALRRTKIPCFPGPPLPPPTPPGPAEGRSGRHARGILHLRPKSTVFCRANWPAVNPARAQGRSPEETRVLRPALAKSPAFSLARPLRKNGWNRPRENTALSPDFSEKTSSYDGARLPAVKKSRVFPWSARPNLQNARDPLKSVSQRHTPPPQCIAP